MMIIIIIIIISFSQNAEKTHRRTIPRHWWFQWRVK